MGMECEFWMLIVARAKQKLDSDTYTITERMTNEYIHV
jgi:hypothetical protein